MAATKQKEQDKPTAAAVLEPPTVTRTRTSTVSQALIDDMLDKIKESWVSDGLDYASKKDASNASVVHRRALVRALGGDPNNADDPTRERVSSRVWEVSGTNGKGTGKYVFALALDQPKKKGS